MLNGFDEDSGSRIRHRSGSAALTTFVSNAADSGQIEGRNRVAEFSQPGWTVDNPVSIVISFQHRPVPYLEVYAWAYDH